MDTSCDHPPACPPSCTHCLAYDRHTRELCSRVPSTPGSKWCIEHEGIQAKNLKSYKRLTLAVESYDDAALPKGTEMILAEEDMSKLRSWSEAARHKWGLTQRVIVARAEHHSQFYAGGDWGHCLFVESLKTESERLERLMRALDRRAYALTLAKSEAEWILAAPAVNFICDEPTPNDAPLTPPPTPPLANQTLPSTSSNKNQRKKASRKAARKNSTSSTSDLDAFLSPPCCAPSADELELHCRPLSQLNRLRSYLIPPSGLPSSIRPSSWVALVSTLFRYVILRTPSLAPLALTVTSAEGGQIVSVEDFLDLLEDRIETRCGEEVGQLWRGMKFATASTGGGKKKGKEPGAQLGVGVLGDAIADVFRDVEEEPGVYVNVLGGRVHKEASKKDLTGEGWDLFYQFISCSGCSLAITRSFASLIRNRRLAILGAYPAWLCPSDTQAEHVFRLAGIELCASNFSTCGKKVKRIEQKESGGKGRSKKRPAVLVEEWERAWAYVRMPLDDPWTASTLATLAAHPDRFAVLARNASTLEVTHRPTASTTSSPCRTPGCSCCRKSDLWLGRVRSGMSPAERKAAQWTTSTFFPVDTVLDSFSANSSPEHRFGHRYSDVMEVLIMDSRSYIASSVSSTTSSTGEWTSFADSLAGVIVQTGGCETLRELLEKGRKESRARGEMEEDGEDAGMEKVSLGATGKGGVSYAAIDERLKAREMFREEY